MTGDGGEVRGRLIETALIDLRSDLLRVTAERDRLAERLEEVRQSTACILAAAGGEVTVPDRIVIGAPARPTVHVERDLGEPVVRFCVDLDEWRLTP